METKAMGMTRMGMMRTATKFMATKLMAVMLMATMRRNSAISIRHFLWKRIPATMASTRLTTKNLTAIPIPLGCAKPVPQCLC